MKFEDIFKYELIGVVPGESVLSEWWTDIAKAYSSKGRHYHNLTHLDQLISHLMEIKVQIQDWPAVVFAVAWHDLVYNTSKSDNEEKSAEYAERHLKNTIFAEDRIKKCVHLILATKKHEQDVDEDVNHFTDADLAILGADELSYLKYAEQIRQEYRRYPDFLYKPGRKKVLKHFLEMESIYKTTYFRNRFEQNARRNISEELGSL